MTTEDWFIVLAGLLLIYFWYQSRHQITLHVDQDSHRVSAPLVPSQPSLYASPSLPIALSTTSAPSAPSAPSATSAPTAPVTPIAANSSLLQPALQASATITRNVPSVQSARQMPTPSTLSNSGVSLSDISQWIDPIQNTLQTYVQHMDPRKETNIPTAINLVPHVGPFGITTGDPLDDTPLIFPQNNVVALWSQASEKYLQFVPVEDAIGGFAVTVEYDLVVQATAKDAIYDKSAQWVVRPGLEGSSFPNAFRLENVLYRGRFLKGFQYKHEVPTQTLNSQKNLQEEGGWQPGKGKTTQSNIYTTMLKHIDPQTSDRSSIVLWSSLLSVKNKTRLDRKSPVYLAVDASGVVINPRAVASLNQIAWRCHNIGRETMEGKIVYATTNLAELRKTSALEGELSGMSIEEKPRNYFKQLNT